MAQKITSFDLYNLNFKIPSTKETEHPIKRTLTPKQYAEFIEYGVKLAPNFKKFLKLNTRSFPKVRFKL